MRAPLVAAIVLAVCTAIACSGGGDDQPQPTEQLIISGPTTPAVRFPTRTEIGETDVPETETVTPEPTPTPEPVLVSLDWLAADLAIPPLAAPIAGPRADGALKAAVEAALADFDGKASVVVQNLADGRYAEIGAGESWYAASTFKAGVLLAAYQQRDAGILDFGKIVAIEPKYAENDLGTLEYLGIRPNDLVTIGDAVKAMIVVSDTSMAGLVQDNVGGNEVDAAMRGAGATVMTVNDRALPTTANDLAALLRAMISGQGVSAASRDEMLSLLGQEWFTAGVVAGLPPGTQYAHKSGNLGEATHDAAIVWGPDGPYIVVVMTDGSGAWTPIAEVSAAVWEYFAAP